MLTVPNPDLAFAADHGGQGLFLRKINGQEAPILTNIGKPKAHRDHAGNWLRVAMIALAVLAATAATVSYAAQFRLIYAYKADKIIAGLQAGIPDVAALVFAALGIALSLHGKRALRARFLNLAAVGTSVTMNILAAGHGWKSLAVWSLAPIAYAVTSDSLIAVLRSHTLARLRELREGLADEEPTPLALLAKLVLYGMRLVVAPISTLRGARRALLNATPLPAEPAELPKLLAFPLLPVGPAQELLAAKSPRAIEPPRSTRPAKPRTATRRTQKSGGKPGGKQQQLIDLATEKHGLATLPINQVSKLATRLSEEVGLHPATGRRVLVAHARTLNGSGQ